VGLLFLFVEMEAEDVSRGTMFLFTSFFSLYPPKMKIG